MAWYRTGRIAVTAGSTTVTGTGTAFVENVRVGDGLQGPDGRQYEITNVASNTTLAITPAYMGSTTSNQAYWVIPIQGYVKKLADQAGVLVNEFGEIPGTVGTLQDTYVNKNNNLSELANKATARNNLGLGGAATRDAGTSNGQLLEVGAGGWLGAASLGSYISGYPQSISQNTSQIYRRETVDLGVASYSSSIHFAADATWGRLRVSYSSPRAWIQGGISRTGAGWTVELRHTGNTTVDSNGFIKAASPILKLFSDRIEKTEHLEIAETEFERLGVGHYVLHNAPLLSSDGWYIETPKDRNNNIYFYLDYVANETDKTLTIKTYEPDYSSGRAEAGAPMDIIDGRFVSLRFEEDPSLYPELEEPKTEEE